MEDRARKNAKKAASSGVSAYDHEEVIHFDDEEFEDYIDEGAEDTILENY